MKQLDLHRCFALHFPYKVLISSTSALPEQAFCSLCCQEAASAVSLGFRLSEETSYLRDCSKKFLKALLPRSDQIKCLRCYMIILDIQQTFALESERHKLV